VAADGVSKSVAIPEPAEISSTYFLNLQLLSASGQVLSRNFYWLSSKPDVLDFAKTEWYYTPQTDFADFSALQDLPKASVRAAFRPTPGNQNDAAFHVVLENSGKSVAFLTRLRLVKGKEHMEILPVFWNDNYLALLPGEKREISVRVRKSDLGGVLPELLVDGWNLEQITFHTTSR
jgi:exo-1,4-beta-D-glucosaminidase